MAKRGKAGGELGKLLAAGALRAARYAFERLPEPAKLASYLGSKFPSLNESEVRELTTITRQYAEAGWLLKQIPEGHRLSIQAIPIVPTGFGVAQHGRRFSVSARVTVLSHDTGIPAISTVSVEYATLPESQDIIRDLSFAAGEFSLTTLPAGTSVEEAITDIIDVTILGVFRVF